MLLEPVVADFPLGPAVDQPFLGLGQRAGLQPAGPDPALLLAADEPADLERLEVLEHRRQAHGEGLSEFADRGRAVSQAGQHPPPGAVGKRLEGTVEPGRIVKHMIKYRVAGMASRY